MRLTDARQLDALPEGAEVVRLVPDDDRGVLADAFTRHAGGWCCEGGASRYRWSPDDILPYPTYLLEATARTPEDLERLLPGAVLEDGTFLGGRDDEGRLDWYPPGTDDIARSAHMGFPVRILYPGNPIDTEEA